MKYLSYQEENILEIKDQIKAGSVLVYPTETCYGLGCDATNASSVQKIVQIKHRREGHPFLLLFKDISMLGSYVLWNDTVENIASRYWPGALTIVLPLREGVVLPDEVVGEDRTIACRISSHPFVKDFFSLFEKPIVSTSANISGEPAFYDAKKGMERFQTEIHQPDLIVDAGILPENPSSTIIRIKEKQIRVLRQGSVIVS